jgi:hypothetical protein
MTIISILQGTLRRQQSSGSELAREWNSDAAVQQSGQFRRLKCPAIYHRFAAELFSCGAGIVFNRKRRETGDGPI